MTKMTPKMVDKKHLEKHSEIDMKITKVEKDIEYMKQAFAEAIKEHKIILERIDKFIEVSEKKFANKEIETEVEKLKEWQNNINVRMATIVGGSIVAFFILQIILTKMGII